MVAKKHQILTCLFVYLFLFQGNLPNILYIQRKPEPLGTEFKTVACGETGVMTYLEIQRGREGMKDAEFTKEMTKTAACAARLMKYSPGPPRIPDEEGNELVDTVKPTYLGDAYFGSVPAVLAADKLGCNLIAVIKNSHARYPKKFFETEMAEWPPGSNLVAEANIEGVDCVAIGYKYSKHKVLTFIMNKGAASVRPGDPYVAKWKDKYQNTVSRFVPRPQAISAYFMDCNKIDTHNQSRQFDLRLEKLWVTRCGFFRVATTLLGICVLDAWKTYRHHINTCHCHHNIELMDFTSILVNDLLNNSLTRKAPLPPESFNIALVGTEITVPEEDQEPEIPAFEKLTQDSVFALAGVDEVLNDVLEDAMPTWSVERGEHGLRKTEEYVNEPVQEMNERDEVIARKVNRRKRGRCRICGKKTPWYCPKCTEEDPKGAKYWCYGPDVPNGKECYYKHDTEWVFRKDLNG